jgi:GNAT superfamily N-acetyltransferase
MEVGEMSEGNLVESGLEFHPLVADRWPDLEKLFGPRGACGGCWCMYWRLPRREYEAIRGEGARVALNGLVQGGAEPGILAYADGEPIGWCALAPRETYPVLEGSRILKRVDDRPVWSIVCFFVARRWRRKGLTVRLLQAAAKFACERGARIIEGYPVEPKEQRPDAFVYTGMASAFRKAGFVEVARRSETRPIMRRETGNAKGEA